MFLLIRNSGRCRRGYARNLHSTMFLLILASIFLVFVPILYLHSTMFLLIHFFVRKCTSKRGYLHSTMFLLIQMQRQTPKTYVIHLHSTMFLLILHSMRDSQSIYPIFTFHNVSINSQKLIRFIVPSRQFTFHNVSINSLYSSPDKKEEINLHSTMFLLILYFSLCCVQD